MYRRYAMGEKPLAIAATTITTVASNRNEASAPPKIAHAIDPKTIDETHQSDPACLTRSSKPVVPGIRNSSSSSHGVGLSLSCFRIVPSVGLSLSCSARLLNRRRIATSVWLGRVNKTTNAKQTIKTSRKTSLKDIENPQACTGGSKILGGRCIPDALSFSANFGRMPVAAKDPRTRPSAE